MNGIDTGFVSFSIFVALKLNNMSQQTFQVFLCAMGLTALFVFIALYFIKAGYGMFRTASWGVSIDNKSAWILMESPVFFVMLILWAYSGTGTAVPEFIFCCYFYCTIFSVRLSFRYY